MTLFTALAFIWLMAGIQVLLFMIWVLVSQRLPFRLTWRGGFTIVLFWPDTIAGLVGNMRASRRQASEDDHEPG